MRLIPGEPLNQRQDHAARFAPTWKPIRAGQADGGAVRHLSLEPSPGGIWRIFSTTVGSSKITDMGSPILASVCTGRCCVYVPGRGAGVLAALRRGSLRLRRHRLRVIGTACPLRDRHLVRTCSTSSCAGCPRGWDGFLSTYCRFRAGFYSWPIMPPDAHEHAGGVGKEYIKTARAKGLAKRRSS